VLTAHRAPENSISCSGADQIYARLGEFTTADNVMSIDVHVVPWSRPKGRAGFVGADLVYRLRLMLPSPTEYGRCRAHI
jgi:hypothetical protein